jgi:hypothetical protein
MKFSRQVRVIGREAQKKVESAVVVVPPNFAGEIARRYCEGAGMRVQQGDVPAFQDARFDDMHPSARDVALGARAAVAAIMVAIET